MKASRKLQILILCAMITAFLASCGTAQDSLSIPGAEHSSQGGNAGTLGRVLSWLTQLAWGAAGIPVIGPLITDILQELAPQNHWCVGAVLIWLVLSVLGGGSGSSGRS